MIHIEREQCTGCGACVEVCPAEAIRVIEGTAHIDQDLCQECRRCLEACPLGAIVEEKEPAIAGELIPLRPEPAAVVRPARELQRLRPAPKTLAWLGAALAFVGREIVPRLAVSLLDAWDDRRARDTGLATNGSASLPRAGPSGDVSVRPARKAAGSASRGRHRHRGGR
jgi:NAD-dependent dihydropyrimidine dehydrogenase PreA subunit